MWNLYKVTFNFNGKLCGSVPLAKEMIEPWLRSRMPKNKPDESAATMEELIEEVEGTIQEAEERVTLGFQKNEDGLFLRAGCVKAHIKDCANQTKDYVGVKAFRSKVANKVYIDPYAVLIHRDGEVLQEPDGEEERPVRAMTARGPISALKRIQFVEKASITVTMRVLEDKEVKIDTLYAIFDYGMFHGLGGERGMGEGTYQYTVEEITEK